MVAHRPSNLTRPVREPGWATDGPWPTCHQRTPRVIIGPLDGISIAYSRTPRSGMSTALGGNPMRSDRGSRHAASRAGDSRHAHAARNGRAVQLGTLLKWRRSWIIAAASLVLVLAGALLGGTGHLAGSPSTTTPPTTTPPASATQRSPRAFQCTTGSGVAIGRDEDAESVVDANGPGATYIVKAGTHQQNFSVQPKSGDTFCGEPARCWRAAAACGSPSPARPLT
jgi:hypothetical protein